MLVATAAVLLRGADDEISGAQRSAGRRLRNRYRINAFTTLAFSAPIAGLPGVILASVSVGGHGGGNRLMAAFAKSWRRGRNI